MAKKDKGAMMNNAPLGEFSEPVTPSPTKVKEPKKSGGQKDKKPNVFKRIGKFFKEMWSELKKVTWPTFPKVLKQTGVVLGVVVLFLVLLFGIDFFLSWLLSLLTGVSRF